MPKTILFLILFLVAVSGCSQSPIQKVSLPNGHVLILKPSSQTQSVALHYFLPGLHAQESISGLGNFCIRLMLKATQKHAPQELADLIESRGGSVGGMWDYDYAGFSILATHKNFIDQVRLMQEIIDSPRLDANEFQKLKKEILQEIKNRKEDAFDTALIQLSQSMFRVDPLSGTYESISKISLEQVQSFYKNQIHGKSAIISIAGNFDVNTVKKLFAKHQVHPSSNKKTSAAQIPARNVFKEIKINAPFEAQTYLLGFDAPVLNSADYPAFKVLNNLLGGKSSSRIFMSIRERQGLGYSLGSFYPSRKTLGQLVCYIQVDPKAGKLFPQLFNAEIEKIKKTVISDEELESAIAHVKGQFIMDHQSNSRQSWYLGWFELNGRGFEYDQKYAQELEKVTVQDIHSLSQKYLTPVLGVRVTQ